MSLKVCATTFELCVSCKDLHSPRVQQKHFIAHLKWKGL